MASMAAFFGTVGVAATGTTAAVAPTVGLIGAGGSFLGGSLSGIGIGTAATGVTASGVSVGAAGTIAGISTITGVLGTGLSVYSLNKAGEQAVLSAKGDKAIAAANANIAKRKAQDIRNRTTFEQRRLAIEQSRKASALQAKLGISGVISTAGAALELQVEQAERSELDQLMLGFEGRARENQAISQRQIFQMQSRMAGAEISFAKEAAILKPAGAFVRGAGGLAIGTAKRKTALESR